MCTRCVFEGARAPAAPSQTRLLSARSRRKISVIQSAPCHVTANIIVTLKTMCVFKPDELGHAKTNPHFKCVWCLCHWSRRRKEKRECRKQRRIIPGGEFMSRWSVIKPNCVTSLKTSGPAGLSSLQELTDSRLHPNKKQRETQMSMFYSHCVH